MINQKYVYHASKVRGLKILEPRASTHKIPWVYATMDIPTATLFLGDNFDFICQTGISNEKPYIWERFKGAFNLAYENKKGSLYYLSPSSFKQNMTSFSPEIVSEVPVKVEKEVFINNVKEYLLDLHKQGKISIYFFPEVPEGKSSNKKDIVERGIDWTIDFGENTLEQVEQYHPDILDRVINGLLEKKYIFKSKRWSKYNK
ncbi:hypothetical protein A3J98_01515 [candidate division WS6 bacterium RIFOXYC1_FULL_33_10]|uniref:Uncharacterized protein n=1 Tax=candidate division WS6 bacterium RIFOXYC1_FULL_33_10 TaxID=1802606 RepID=A0A1F4UJ13_9BACT|nr:MAG: hypothetical protein A3J98_01515 [candidate division WS6 bacterium RIFOXYC1_FULL_33_10]